jgi:hypothetical protein
MAAVSGVREPAAGGPSPDATEQNATPLHVATISKADHWIDDVLPRFTAYVRAHCTGTVRLHLLLLVDPQTSPGEADAHETRARRLFDSVVRRPFVDPEPGRRLLAFDELRAGLTTTLGLPEVLYLDPDTDVVADLQGIQRIAPEAALLWAANPLPLEPVIADLVRCGFSAGPDAGPLVEPGFLYLRRDLAAEFGDVRMRFPDVHRFAPGSTYWNMLARSLGPQAVRLPDEFNRTFWDVPAAAATARSVHFTGQWKRLQPLVEYRRDRRELVVHAQPPPLPAAPSATAAEPRDSPVVATGSYGRAEPKTAWPRRPAAICVVALYRDNAAYLPHAFARFEAWERAGLPVRYHVLENDSTDGTAALLADFLRGRPGRLTSRSLALRYERRGNGYDRIMPLARMRSFLADEAAATAPLHPDEWTLLIDSEIYFPADILERMFAAAARDPRPDSLGLLTCYTQHLFTAEQVPKVGRPAPEMPGLRLADHYYDTFALHDEAHRNHAPFCPFARCRYCAVGRPTPYPLPLVPVGQAIVDVASACGGFALLPTALFRDPRLRWTTYGTGVAQAAMLSEHVLFCDRLRTITGRRVVVLQDVDCVYRH